MLLGSVTQCAVRSATVVVSLELVQHGCGVLSVEDQKTIAEFAGSLTKRSQSPTRTPAALKSPPHAADANGQALQSANSSYRNILCPLRMQTDA